MDTILGTTLRSISTSNQWSVIDGVVTKLNKKLPKDQHTTAKELSDFLTKVDDKTLQNNGIWYIGLGTATILCINRAFGNARYRGDDKCKCKDVGGSDSGAVEKFYGSTAYNGGRHAYTGSKHIGSCFLWRPPNSGHLHSWRRGYTDDKI